MISSDDAGSTSEKLWEPRTVFAERICGRRVIYLDHNLWIDLRDSLTNDAQSCRGVCLQEVQRGHAIFPVSYAAVSEMLDLSDLELRKRHATLMDQLSLGVTLRTPERIRILEAKVAYERFLRRDGAALDRAELFSLVPDYVGDSEILFGEEWTLEMVSTFMGVIRNESRVRSLEWFAEHLPEAERLTNHQTQNTKYVERMTAILEETDRDFRIGRKVDKQRLVMRERIALFSQVVLPTMQKEFLREFGPDYAAVNRMVASWGDGNPKRFGMMFREWMPAIELLVQLVVGLTLDPRRKSTPQDFWDIDHASVAPVYTDAFVTKDGFLRHQLVMHRKNAAGPFATVLTSAAELEAWLLQPNASLVSG